MDDDASLQCSAGRGRLRFHAALVGWRLGLGCVNQPAQRPRGLIGGVPVGLTGRPNRAGFGERALAAPYAAQEARRNRVERA